MVGEVVRYSFTFACTCQSSCCKATGMSSSLKSHTGDSQLECNMDRQSQQGDSTQSLSRRGWKGDASERLMIITRGARQSSRRCKMFQMSMAAAIVASRQAAMSRQQEQDRCVQGPILQKVTSPITSTKPVEERKGCNQ